MKTRTKYDLVVQSPYIKIWQFVIPARDATIDICKRNEFDEYPTKVDQLHNCIKDTLIDSIRNLK